MILGEIIEKMKNILKILHKYIILSYKILLMKTINIHF